MILANYRTAQRSDWLRAVGGRMLIFSATYALKWGVYEVFPLSSTDQSWKVWSQRSTLQLMYFCTVFLMGISH